MITSPPSMRATLALLVLLALTAFGCERSPAGTVPDRATGVGANGAGAAESDASAGCETIEDCDSFLSCIDGTCQTPPAVSGRHESDTPVVTFVDDRGPDRTGKPDETDKPDESGQKVASFFVELALTPAEHQKGLMYRREMKDDWGMLFIYPDEASRSFWMENTFISLDMIFIDAQGRIVNILDEVEPLTRTRRTSTGPARYVLELTAGRASEVGLEPGQRMQLEHVDQEHMPAP